MAHGPSDSQCDTGIREGYIVLIILRRCIFGPGQSRNCTAAISVGEVRVSAALLGPPLTFSS